MNNQKQQYQQSNQNQGGFNNNQQQANQQQNNRPIDKGRVAVVVDRYQTNEVNRQTGQPVMKNRYATVGRATLWPNKQNSNMPNIEVELDTIPLGAVAPLKLYTFWDSENQN